MKSSLTNSLKSAAGGDDDDDSDEMFVLDPTKLTLQDIEVFHITLNDHMFNFAYLFSHYLM